MRSRYRRQPGAGGVLVRGQVRGVGVEQRLVHRDAVRGQRGGRRQLPGGLQRQRGGVQGPGLRVQPGAEHDEAVDSYHLVPGVGGLLLPPATER